MEGAHKTTAGTPDTYFCLSGGKYVFAEYTTQRRGLAAKIKSDIAKCLDEETTGIVRSDLIEIVYCHTSSNLLPKDDYAVRKLCTDAGVKLTLIGIDSLAEGLMKYPSITKKHLQITIDSEQIQTVADFEMYCVKGSFHYLIHMAGGSFVVNESGQKAVI